MDTRTIGDFGEQWTHFRDNRGYYSSVECLEDVFGPLLDIKEVSGLTVGDIGSGTGRIVSMLLGAGARHVVAVEPSAAFATLQRNTAAQRYKVTLVNGTGEAIATYGPLDLVVSLGVLHHISEPKTVVKAALAALRPGGRFIAWLYGREGNGLYLALAIPLRAITTRLPHHILVMLSGCLAAVASLYGRLCRWIPLPLAPYMEQHFLRLDREQRVLTVYDQLNPAYAKYYRREEAESLLKEAGFSDVQVYNRHRYSWTAIGRKPGSAAKLELTQAPGASTASPGL